MLGASDGSAGAVAAVARLRLPSCLQEVNQHIIPERFGGCEKGPSTVEAGQFFDKAAQMACGVERKNVDPDTLPATAGDLQ